MPELIRFATNGTVFALMVVAGLDCSLADLGRNVRRRRLLAAVTLSQFTVVPAIAVLVCLVLGLQGTAAASLVLLCCCPAGTISNSYTFISGGNTSLSVAFTTVSCLLATVATPGALLLFNRLSGGQGDAFLIPPGPLLQQLFVAMALPLVLGLVLRHRFPVVVTANLRNLRWLSAALVLGLIVLIALSVPRQSLVDEARALAIPALLLTALLLPLGVLTSRLFRVDRGDSRALLFEFPCQNLAIVALVGIGVLNQPQLVVFAVVCFVIQAVVLLLLAQGIARRA